MSIEATQPDPFGTVNPATVDIETCDYCHARAWDRNPIVHMQYTNSDAAEKFAGVLKLHAHCAGWWILDRPGVVVINTPMEDTNG